MSEPEIGSNGKDEDLKALVFDPKQPADDVMICFQIATAYREMSRMAAEFDSPTSKSMALAFRMAMYHTLQSLYNKIMNEQSAVVRRRIAAHLEDEAHGIDEKYKRVSTMWQTMEDMARAAPCFICRQLILPEFQEIHLREVHPRRDPLGINEASYAEHDAPVDSEEWETRFGAAPKKRRRVKQV